MRRLALVAAVLVSMPAAAAELGPVTDVDRTMMNQIFGSQKVEATTLIEDSTVLGRLGSIPDELREALPLGDHFVVHFAANGDLLAWSEKSEIVEVGYWELIGNGGFNDLCIRFGHFGLTSLCAGHDIEASDWMIESTPGNPFGLAPGAAVPGKLGASELSLDAIAARLLLSARKQSG
jgi:hypothetical protein